MATLRLQAKGAPCRGLSGWWLCVRVCVGGVGSIPGGGARIPRAAACSQSKTQWQVQNTMPTTHIHCVCVVSCSVMPDSLRPSGLQPAKLFCPWDFSSKNTGVGCHFLLQGLFLTRGSNLHLLDCSQILKRWATRPPIYSLLLFSH